MTATITGTASNAADFLSTLVSFLTTNGTLSGAGEAWSEVWTAPSGSPTPGDIVVRGPGLAGTDNIYVGMRLDSDAVNNRYILWFNGMQALLTGSATGITGHANPSQLVGIYLDSAPFEYWISASGRRFMITVQLAGTVFESAYCGFFLPYADPAQYPVPLFIGGTRGYSIDSSYNLTFRSSDAYHSQFSNPQATSGSQNSSACVLDPTGQWFYPTNNTNFNASMAPRYFGTEAFSMNALNGEHYGTLLPRITQTFDGGYALLPVTICEFSPSSQSFGILDDFYMVSGNGNASGNTITVGGKTYLVEQNVFRTGFADYSAMLLG